MTVAVSAVEQDLNTIVASLYHEQLQVWQATDTQLNREVALSGCGRLSR